MAGTYPYTSFGFHPSLIQRQCRSCRPVSVSCLSQSHGLAKTCLGVFVIMDWMTANPLGLVCCT